MVTMVVTRRLEVASGWEDLNRELSFGGLRRPDLSSYRTKGLQGCRSLPDLSLTRLAPVAPLQVVFILGGGADGRIGASSVLLELGGCQGLDRVLHFVLGSSLHFSRPCCIFSSLEGVFVKVCITDD
jgi:hypothetical protein